MHLSALFWTCKTSLILASLTLFCLCAYQCLYCAACRKKARGGKSSRAARPLCVPMCRVPLLLLYSISILAEALIYSWEWIIVLVFRETGKNCVEWKETSVFLFIISLSYIFAFQLIINTELHLIETLYNVNIIWKDRCIVAIGFFV